MKLILRADRAARAFDNRIVQVRAGYSEELRRILIAGSDGSFASDTQPLCRLNVFVIARQYDTWVQQASGAVLIGTLGSVVTLTATMWLVKMRMLPHFLFQ